MIMFAAGVVSAAENPVIDPIKDWFASWTGGDLSPNIVKYLFWALVSMVVYSVGSNIPGFSGMFKEGKEWLGMAFSIIVGFLSMAYITPDEVYVMMTSYSALGFVVGGAIPFIILIAFTFTLGTDTSGGAKQQLANRAVAWVMWFAFLVFIGYKAIAGLDETGYGLDGLLAISVLAILFMQGALFKKMKKIREKAVIEAAKTKQDLSTAHTKMKAESMENLGN
jgi:hypothetical protein